MNELVWIIDENLFYQLNGAGGISLNYIIPNEHVQHNQQINIGSSLWVLLRGKQKDTLFAKINIDNVERFEDGHNINDYLVGVDLRNSFRVISSLDSLGTWSQTETRNFQVGVSVINDGISALLNTLISKSISKSFKNPSELLIRKIALPIFEGTPDMKAKLALQGTLTSLSLEEVWEIGRAHV